MVDKTLKYLARASLLSGPPNGLKSCTFVCEHEDENGCLSVSRSRLVKLPEPCDATDYHPARYNNRGVT